MNLSKRLILLPALLLAVVCAYAQDVHYNYDRSANFSAYKTYQWVDIPNGAVPDPLVDQAIRRAVDEQLAQKGLSKVEKNADLYIGYQAAIKLEKGLNLFGTGNPRAGGPLDSWGSGSVYGQTTTIPVGMLVLDMYDPGTKQLIWRGDASKTIDLKKDPDKNYKNLQKAAAKLLKNYPPQPNR
jgi:hypothetical protein